MLNHISYDSFGQITSQTNPTAFFRFGYTGREFDQESGQYFYRARYYDPGVGQFISEDPIGFNAGDANIYRYVGNSPTNYTDPSGNLRFQGNPLLDVPDTVDGLAGLLGYRGPTLGGTLRNNIPGLSHFDYDISIDAGEGFGEDAQRWYAERIVDPNTPLWQKPFLYGGGLLSSLWTCETSDATLTTLSLAWGVAKPAAATTIDDVLDSARRAKDKLRNFKDKLDDFFGPKCFVAGTLVLTTKGKKAIDVLRPGDWVLSWNEETGEVLPRAVTEYYQREVPAIIDIFVGAEKISCSPEHPFWVEGKGWILASQLKSGLVLKTRNGELLSVDSVRRRNEVTQVFNVEIDGAHTYFVSDFEILSHNACGNIDKPAPAVPGNDWHPDVVDKRRAAAQDYYDSFFDPKAEAAILGYDRRIASQKAPFNSHGQDVFFDGKNYLTKDVDSHIGGTWKKFDRKGRRIGTFDANLNRIGD